MPSLIWIIIFLLLPTLAFSEVKTIELKHRAAAELLEPVRALLADGEKVQAAGNALLLIADGDSLLAAEQLIVLLDRPLMPLVVRLKNLRSSGRRHGRSPSAPITLFVETATISEITLQPRRGYAGAMHS